MRSALLCFAVALVATLGCAKIKGHSDIGKDVSPGNGTDSGAGDGDKGPPPGDGDGDGDLTTGDGDGNQHPVPDASVHHGDAGHPVEHDAGPMTSDDAGKPPPTGEGTCEMPLPINAPENGGSLTINGDTSDGVDSVVTPCAKDVLLTITGPEKVYQLELPYDAEVQLTVSPRGLFGTFFGTVYVFGACGSKDTQLGCNFDGSLPYGEVAPIKANTKVFVYVDSGGRTLLSPSNKGPYTLQIDIRKVVGEGQTCGTGLTDPSCAAPDGCVAEEGNTFACRVAVCGDGVLASGPEQCDDHNTQDGDGCSATCQIE